MTLNKSLNQFAVCIGAVTVAIGLYKYFTAKSEISKLRGEVGVSVGGLFMITSLTNIELLKD